MNSFQLISAVAMNKVIGDSSTNSIPWHLPNDLKYFKSVTTNKVMVMGKNTFLSFGKKLPNRRHVVITSSDTTDWPYQPDVTYSSLTEALEKEENCIVIGGRRIYEEALQIGPETMFLTLVYLSPPGDVIFPLAMEYLDWDTFQLKTNTGKVDYSLISIRHIDEDIKHSFMVFKKKS